MPARRRGTQDRNTTLLIWYLDGSGGLLPGMSEVTGDIKSTRGPERRRESVLKMEIKRTWVAVALSAEEERAPVPEVDFGFRESTIVPIFEMIISHCKRLVMRCVRR
jgi:hypothetical protein